MEIAITNLQKKTIRPKILESLTRKILRHENVTSGELSLVFVDDRRIKKLNTQFLSRNNPTDVLAFDLSPNIKSRSKKSIRGEIVISTDTAKRNAGIFKTSLGYELNLYLVHGILHLLGFDDTRPKKTKVMRKKETELLDFLKIK